MSSYLSFKIPRLAIFALTLFITLSPISLPKVVEAAAFSLVTDGVSHIGWIFRSATSEWNTTAGNSNAEGDHFGSDYYADDWNRHDGKDCEQDILAPFSGSIIYKGRNYSNGYGNQVVIQSDANNSFAYRATHMLDNSITTNSHVEKGEYIGKVGSTGNSTGCHVHSVLYQKIFNTVSGSTTAYNRLTSGDLVGSVSGGPTQFAARFYNDGTDGGGNPGTTCNTIGSYNGIRLYDQDACNGSSTEWNSSSNGTIINVGDRGWNDRARSVYVGSGWSVKVFEHSNGEGKWQCFRENKWDLDVDQWEGGGIIGANISSIIVYNNSTCTGGIPSTTQAATFYMDANYQGSNCGGNNPGSYPNFNGCGSWDNAASSVLVKAGHSVRVFEHPDFGGGNKCYTGNDNTFAGDHFDNGLEVNDRVSSFIIYAQTSCPSLVQIPNAPSLSAPANGASYTDIQPITLSWSGNGNEYYVEINGGPSGSLNTGWITGTSASIGTQWAGHTYTWRVKARNSAGESGWSGTRTFTVTTHIQTPTTPSLSSPANGASYTDAQPITLSWGGNGAEYYAEISGGPAGTLNTGWITGTSTNLGTQWAGHTYTWRVKARNSAGESAWSSTRTFTVTQAVQVPGAPSLTSPANGATFNNTQEVGLSWSGSGTEFYGEVSGPSGSSFGWKTGNNKNLGVLTVGSYTWRIKARNSAGEGAWSETRSFTVTEAGDTTVPTGVMTSPTKDSTQNGPNILLKANASDNKSGVKKVQFYAWSDHAWSNSNWILLGGDNTAPYEYNWDVSALGAETYAFVSISVTDNADNVSGIIGDTAWTHFTIKNTVITAPAAPTLTNPENNGVFNVGQSVQLSWVGSGTEYFGEVAGGPNGTRTFGWQPTTNKTYANLQGGHAYTWRVKARNSAGESPWSATWTFYVGDCNDVSSASVKLFADQSCRGTVQDTVVGFANLSNFDNTAESVFIPAGMSARVWSEPNKGGATRCAGGSMWNFNIDNYEDGSKISTNGVSTVSSVEVYNNTTCTPPVVVNPTGCDTVTSNGVTLFTTKACSGESMNVTTSEFTKLAKPNNNAFKSIFVRGGWSIKVFANKDKTGAKKCIKATVKNLAKETYNTGEAIVVDGKSTISAFQVFNSPNCK